MTTMKEEEERKKNPYYCCLFIIDSDKKQQKLKVLVKFFNLAWMLPRCTKEKALLSYCTMVVLLCGNMPP
jgi:hypothetical protein